jgi:hypothetical protein
VEKVPAQSSHFLVDWLELEGSEADHELWSTMDLQGTVLRDHIIDDTFKVIWQSKDRCKIAKCDIAFIHSELDTIADSLDLPVMVQDTRKPKPVPVLTTLQDANECIEVLQQCLPVAKMVSYI